MGQELALEFLKDPRNYPHPSDHFEVHQTHISWVFLVGPYAYKLKKAVSLGFLDYSTLELRRRYCREELRLNRRLARGVYLDVVALRERDGKVFFAADGEAAVGREIDSVVRMKRLSNDIMLDALVRKGKARREHIDRLVGVLVPFYHAALRSRAPDVYGTPDVMRGIILQNLELTKPLVGELLSRERFEAIRSGQLSYLTLRKGLFEKRLREGWVRDGHGDLRAEHVGFLPECIVMDCIEFNDRYRIVDVAADLAFLKMDLEFLGAPALAKHLIERYVEASRDEELRSLLEFYSSYRAYVRGKVDGIKLHQEEVDPADKQVLENRAKRYFEVAHFHTLTFHRPLLLLVGGLSGSGKSTLARLLSERLGAPHLRSDEVRKELTGVAAGKSRPGPGAGIYSEEHTLQTYGTLAERAGRLLEEGATVIVDATFSRRWQRELFQEMAREVGTGWLHVECRVATSLAAERLRGRQAEGRDVSDATVAIQEAQNAAYEEPGAGEAVPVDTTGPPEGVLEAVLEVLRDRSNTDC